MASQLVIDFHECIVIRLPNGVPSSWDTESAGNLAKYRNITPAPSSGPPVVLNADIEPGWFFQQLQVVGIMDGVPSNS